jgi:uncharacterized protein YjiS (DUF1127 family)
VTNEMMDRIGTGRIAREAVSPALGFLDAVVTWWRIRRDERYLLEQSDAHLKDIGLARSDIVQALRGVTGPGGSRPGR